MGWNGFNGGDPYFAGANASAAVLNTNLCTAVAFLAGSRWDFIFKEKPSLIGSVNGMITGSSGITPAAGFVNGYGAICDRPDRLDDRLDVDPLPQPGADIPQGGRHPGGGLHTRDSRAVSGGLMVGVFADPNMVEYVGLGNTPSVSPVPGVIHGDFTLIKWQALAGLFIICFDGIMTFIILKLISIFIPLRLSDEELEIGDHAIHGNEVYPADVPTLGATGGSGLPLPAPA